MNSAWLACLMFWRSIWVTIKNTINFTSATSLDINEVQKLQNLLLPLICCTYKPAKVLCIQKPFTTNHNILMYFMFFVCLLIYLLNIACLWKILQLKWSILYVLSLNIFIVSLSIFIILWIIISALIFIISRLRSLSTMLNFTIVIKVVTKIQDEISMMNYFLQ